MEDVSVQLHLGQMEDRRWKMEAFSLNILRWKMEDGRWKRLATPGSDGRWKMEDGSNCRESFAFPNTFPEDGSV
jgi:hypothetical protein